ncbi:MAG: DNA alkylation repair protein [Bacteroidales bacterium]
MSKLEACGSEQTKKVLMKHGAREPFFGVKVEYLTKISRETGIDHGLALKLYRTGNSDAMYLAGMICDPRMMNPAILDEWADQAYWYYLSEYTVPPVAAKSDHGIECALRWMESDIEHVAAGSWATLSNVIVKRPDINIDTDLLRQLVNKVTAVIHTSPNRVRYCMNNFIIAVGSGVDDLKQLARESAIKTGKVHVDMGGTACKVPDALEYMAKTEARLKKNESKKTSKKN